MMIIPGSGERKRKKAVYRARHIMKKKEYPVDDLSLSLAICTAFVVTTASPRDHSVVGSSRDELFLCAPYIQCVLLLSGRRGILEFGKRQFDRSQEAHERVQLSAAANRLVSVVVGEFGGAAHGVKRRG